MNKGVHSISKESFQFDFPVMIHSFLIHFIEKALTSRSQLNSMESSRPVTYQLILKSYHSSEQKVLFLRSGHCLDGLLCEITDRISEIGMTTPISGFELVGIPKRTCLKQPPRVAQLVPA